MKKIFLFAAAAMVSLSSCVQTEDVYTGGLNEIGFKTAAVRGAIEGTTFGGNMAVAAAWDGNADSENPYVDYFKTLATPEATGANFTGEAGAGNAWSGNPPRYWPNAGNMQFIALYPYECGKMNYAINATTGLTSYTVEGIANEANQHDVLFSDLHAVEAPQTSAQPLLFHHAMALLQVNFKTSVPSEEVKIVSATVNNVIFDGDLTVTAGAAPAGAAPAKSTASWNVTDSTPKNYTFKGVDATHKLTETLDEDATDLLVIPTAQTSMTIVYTFNGHKMTKTVKFNEGEGEGRNNYGDWEMGKRYIYNFTIGANEIQFTVSVDNWVDTPVNGGGITI